MIGRMDMGKILITSDMIESFCVYLKSEEKSSNTMSKYLRDTKAFAKFIDGREVSKELVIEYKEILLAKGYATNSINSMIASINSFMKFIGLENFKIKSIKQQKAIFRSEEKELTKNEYNRLICAAESKGNERLNLIIQTICGTGIRVSELQFITIESVKKGEAVVSCKGKRRRIFIVKALQKKLLKYAAKKNIKSGCIFITRTGRPVNRTNIWRDMKKLCKSANVNPNKVFPHNLRHLFARVFYGIEKDIAKLSDILGHSNINTTRIYIMSTSSEHRRCMENMHLII